MYLFLLSVLWRLCTSDPNFGTNLVFASLPLTYASSWSGKGSFGPKISILQETQIWQGHRSFASRIQLQICSHGRWELATNSQVCWTRVVVCWFEPQWEVNFFVLPPKRLRRKYQIWSCEHGALLSVCKCTLPEPSLQI